METTIDNNSSQEQIIARVRYLMDKIGVSQAGFARKIDLNPSNVSKYLSGKLPIADGFINRICVNTGVSRDWLRDGRGVPFAKETSVDVIGDGEAIEVNSDEISHKGVPVYDVDVTAGCVQLDRMLTNENLLGFVDLPQINPECLIVRVTGDSMDPVVKSGGYISIRPIRNINSIYWGRIYVVVTDDYRMVKYMRRHPDPSKVILHSANSEYDDMEINTSEIRSLFIVEAVLHYDVMA